MTKLLNAFDANPTPANARKVVAYLNKHMMAECMATADERASIDYARSVAGE